MSDITNPVEDLFARALELPESQRETFLAEQCVNDESRLNQVRELLAAHEQTGSFVVDRNPSFGSDPGDNVAASVQVGSKIGPYKLLQEIGEGGMGVVFMADQKEPIKRRVALKIIKPGMDSKQVLARFEAERQALAMMEHPNIAKVYEAGKTDGGLPYFVMELVKGVPITKFCDDNQMTAKERLELFVDVCMAVQHAHQKGIIHRDLKPSNVLVAKFDDKPVVKVIDFGVAKATNQELTEQTMFRQFGQIVGTLEYMSPEQAQFNQLDIDTRSDIYSLGVLLYELLTGAPPFDRQRLRTAAFDEIMRIIREEEPPRPSARLSTLGKDADSVSKSRNSEIGALGRVIRGDVDWIVMKAIEKDRSRRYESASGLANDVKNYLKDEVVSARPPSVLNQLQKIWKRNRIAFLTLGAILAVLALGLGISLTLYFDQRRIGKELDTTLAQLQRVIVRQGFQHALIGEDVKATLEIAENAKVPRTWILAIEGAYELHQGNNEVAIDILKLAIVEDPANIPANCMLSVAYYHESRIAEFEKNISTTDKLQPRIEFADLDQLFLGYAEIYQDRDRAVALMRPILRKHPSWIFAHAMLGGALGEAAFDQQSSKLALEAVSETEIARAVASDNQFVLMVSLFAHLSACEQGSNESLVARAMEIDKELSKYPEYKLGCYLRALFHESHGNAMTAEVLWHDLAETRGFYSSSAIAQLLRRGLDDTIANLRVVDPRARISKAIALACLGNENLPEARRILDELLASDLSNSWWGRQQLLILILALNDQKLAKKKANEWLDTTHGLNPRERGLVRPVLQKIAGREIGPAPAISRRRIIFFDALALRASGRTELAREELQRFLQLNYAGPIHQWARAFDTRW